MILNFHIPSFPLSHFIDSFVYYKDYHPDHSIERFLPDGASYIVIDLTDHSRPIYHNETLKEIQNCRKVWFSGIRTKYITIPSGRDMEMFVINFHKGRSYPFLNIPVNELTDITVDGELVLSSEILNMRDSLIKLPPAEKFIAAEKYLMRSFASKLVINPVIDYAVNTITSSPQQLSINKLSEKVGYSQKHFIKIFKEHVGVSPKAFLKIIRFQKAIQEIDAKKESNWISVAHECGFYDQAHFINDFREFSGYTPNQYVQAQTTYTNYVIVE